MPQCAEPMPGLRQGRLHLRRRSGKPRSLIQPSGHRRHQLVADAVQPGHRLFLRARHGAHQRLHALRRQVYQAGLRYTGGTQAAPIGSPMSGTFTAIDAKTNKIAWQHKTPYRIGGGGGSTVTAGGLVLRGEPDGNFLALDAKTGEELFRFQTGFGADAPPVVYEVDGEQFIAIATGGNQMQGSAYGDAVWTFSLKGQLGPLWPPPPPPTVAGPTGPIAAGVDTIKIGANNVEYSFAAGPHPDQERHHGDLHQCRRPSARRDARCRQDELEHGRAGQGRDEDHHLQQARHLLLHLHAASLDVRAGDRRVIVAEAERDQHAFSRLSARRRLFPGAEQWRCPMEMRVPASRWRAVERIAYFWLALACVLFSAPIAANEAAEPSATGLIEGCCRAARRSAVRSNSPIRPAIAAPTWIFEASSS